MSTAITINQSEGSVTSAAGPAAPRPGVVTPKHYWNARAERFAASGAGLAAVCSYGMPAFYNAYIDLLQKRALGRWLKGPAHRVLDVGCGVGRWSRRLARAGHNVVGIDLSSVMVLEARRRAQAEDVDARCRFLVGDTACLPVGNTFDCVLAVTVLQHILDRSRFESCLEHLTDALAADGVIVLLEAAPSRPSQRCDSGVFVARSEAEYLAAFEGAGLRCLSIHAVDPAPFKTWFLPWYGRLPRPAAVSLLFLLTVASLPIDLLAASWGRTMSWHKVFVLTRAGSDRA